MQPPKLENSVCLLPVCHWFDQPFKNLSTYLVQLYHVSGKRLVNYLTYSHGSRDSGHPSLDFCHADAGGDGGDGVGCEFCVPC